MRLQYSKGVLSVEVSGRTRQIGTVKNRVLTVFRDKKLDYLKKYDGYGFNYAVLNDERLFDHVLIEEKVDDELTNYYLVSRQDILKHGIIDQTEDLEKEIYLPMYTLKKFNKA